MGAARRSWIDEIKSINKQKHTNKNANTLVVLNRRRLFAFPECVRLARHCEERWKSWIASLYLVELAMTILLPVVFSRAQPSPHRRRDIAAVDGRDIGSRF